MLLKGRSGHEVAGTDVKRKDPNQQCLLFIPTTSAFDHANQVSVSALLAKRLRPESFSWLGVELVG